MFDINDLMIPDYNKKSINLFSSNNLIDENYLSLAISHIEETKSIINESTKELYKTLLESSDESHTDNAFKAFFAKVLNVIDRFLNFIKSIYNKAVSKLVAKFASDKYLIKQSGDFERFNDATDTFEIEGYVFTLVGKNPELDRALADFDEELVGISNLEMADAKKFIEAINKKYDELKASLNFDYYDKFRAKVLGVNGSISKEKYHDELFKYFRNGELNKDDKITIHKNDILESLNRLKNYKETLNIANQAKDKIYKEYSDIKTSVNRMIERKSDPDRNNIVGISVSDYNGNKSSYSVGNDVYSKMELFIKAKVGQITEMSNIHALLFSALLTTIKDAYNQDREVLSKALYHMSGR